MDEEEFLVLGEGIKSQQTSSAQKSWTWQYGVHHCRYGCLLVKPIRAKAQV